MVQQFCQLPQECLELTIETVIQETGTIPQCRNCTSSTRYMRVQDIVKHKNLQLPGNLASSASLSRSACVKETPRRKYNKTRSATSFNSTIKAIRVTTLKSKIPLSNLTVGILKIRNKLADQYEHDGLPTEHRHKKRDEEHMVVCPE